MTLKVIEIYPAIMGESTLAGVPCTIVRLSGCNLRCSYCDTQYAYSGGRNMSISEILKSVKKLGQKTVLLTGGEPLLQKESLTLLNTLNKNNLKTVIETNGSVDIKDVPDSATIIMDLKSPGSGCMSENKMENLENLKPDDEIKMVLLNRKDYLWARKTIAQYDLHRFKTILSPGFGMLDPEDLTAWMIKDKVGARLGLQLHKYIFSPDKRRV
jgi:7-carboxy-7-deazaguanine synthase